MGHNNLPVDESTDTTETVSIREYATLERELENLKQLIEIRSEGEQAGLEDIWVAGQPVGKIIESNRRKADSASKQARATGSSEDNPKGSEGENASPDGDLLPIERLAKLREKDEQHPALPKNGRESFERALSIFENYSTWSKKTPKGRTITSGLKAHLETVVGESLAWRQVYRAMDALERWTRGAISHERTSRHGHVLVASERPSSVGATG